MKLKGIRAWISVLLLILILLVIFIFVLNVVIVLIPVAIVVGALGWLMSLLWKKKKKKQPVFQVFFKRL